MESLLKNHENSSELLQLVSFKIGNEEFGADILNIKEINRLTQITKIPNTPNYIDGVINLRGEVIPVIDLRTRIGILRKDPDNNTRIIVSDVQGKTVGFVVDAVREVIRIPVSVTEAPPEIAGGIDSDYIKAVGKLDDRLLILLDLEKIISKDDLKFHASIN